ncbi:MAG: hypothetical protein ACFCU7_06390 [Pleurocapsa sp.]
MAFSYGLLKHSSIGIFGSLGCIFGENSRGNLRQEGSVRDLNALGRTNKSDR